ncbi:MAG: hypothetical protein Fur0042_27410 [Cyanophyceae cyanobacterium]
MKSCFWSLDRLPGLTESDREGLATLAITNSQQLLQRGATVEARRAIAQALHLHEHHVHKWVVLADLARVPSVGDRHCGLLLHAGVTSTVQLAQASVGRLHRDLVRFHVTLYHHRRWCPARTDTEQWIEDARQLVRTWQQRQRATESAAAFAGAGAAIAVP